MKYIQAEEAIWNNGSIIYVSFHIHEWTPLHSFLKSSSHGAVVYILLRWLTTQAMKRDSFQRQIKWSATKTKRNLKVMSHSHFRSNVQSYISYEIFQTKLFMQERLIVIHQFCEWHLAALYYLEIACDFINFSFTGSQFIMFLSWNK